MKIQPENPYFNIISDTYTSIMNPYLTAITKLPDKNMFEEYIYQGIHMSEPNSLYTKYSMEKTKKDELLSSLIYLFRSYMNINPYNSVLFPFTSEIEVYNFINNESILMNSSFINFLLDEKTTTSQTFQLKHLKGFNP